MVLQLEIFKTGPLQVNCSLLYSYKSKEALLIDPGGNISMLLQVIKKKNLNLTKILHTHGHFDHINGSHELFEKFPQSEVKIYMHPNDSFLWQHFSESASAFQFEVAQPKAKVHYDLSDGDTILLDSCFLKVIHTPGHSPGSVCFFIEESEKEKNSILFSGDTLFQNSVGRTDLWGGSHSQLLNSIQNKIYCLPENTRVIPGHGKETTIAEEKQSNPFTRFYS